MPIPEFTHIDFDKDDDPYADGSGYLEKFQQLSQNFTTLAEYNNDVQFSVEQTTQNIIDQTASDRSAIEGLITTTVGTLTSAQAADRLLAQQAAQTAISNSLAAAQTAASIGDVAARVMPMLKRRSLDTVTAIKFKTAEGWEKVGNHSWMNEERPTGRMLGEFANAAAAWASTVDDVAAASGDYYWDTGVNVQLELTTQDNAETRHRFGSRHFPLEALIVLCDSDTSKDLLIFDLTHPLMPVWKRAYVSSVGSWRRFLPYAVFTSMDYRDGVIVLGSNDTIASGNISASYVRGVAIADFKTDRAIHYKERDGYNQSKSNLWQKGLANWNSPNFMPLSVGDNSTAGFLQSYTPNVDFLPGGHIAASAGAGFTVIKPDLNSSVKANSTVHWEAAVELNGRLYAIYDTAVGSGWLVNFGLTDNLTASFTADNSWTPSSVPALSGKLPIALTAGDDSLLFSSTQDLQQLWPNPADPDSSLLARRGLNYATPPMKKPEMMLINSTFEGTLGNTGYTSDFTTDVDGWVAVNNTYVTWDAVNQRLIVDRDSGLGSATGLARKSDVFEIGKFYFVTIVVATGPGAMRYDVNAVFNGPSAGYYAGSGTRTWVVLANNTDLTLALTNSYGDCGIASVTVEEIVPNFATFPDYTSIDGHGRINGTPTAATIATGGVAGIGALTLPTDNIETANPWDGIGTGFGYLCGAFMTGTSTVPEILASIGYYNGSAYEDARVQIYVHSTGVLNFYVSTDGGVSTLLGSTPGVYDDNRLHTYVVRKTDTHYVVSIDGENAITLSVGALGNLVFNASAKLFIGSNDNNASAPNSTIWLTSGAQTSLTDVEVSLMHKQMRNLIEGKAGLDEAPSKLAYDPIRKAFEMVGDTYRQTLQGGAITASVEHESGDSPKIAVGPRSEIAIGGGTGTGSLLTDIPERNLREKTLTKTTRQFQVTYVGDATRTTFPDPTDDAEVAEALGARPVRVLDAGGVMTEGAAEDYTVDDYGLGRYVVEFAVAPGSGNDVIVTFEKEVWV